MKYLKYIIGFLAILTLGFLALGLIKPSISYECGILVEKPITESWAVIQDEEKMSEWLPGFQEIEHVNGTPGTVGAVSNVYFDTDGKTMSIQETITDIVPNESISMLYTSDFMDMDYKMVMTAINDQTKISSSTAARGNGLISRSVMAVIGNSFKSQEESNLTNLKKTIEQNTKDYFPSQEIPRDVEENK